MRRLRVLLSPELQLFRLHMSDLQVDQSLIIGLSDHLHLDSHCGSPSTKDLIPTFRAGASLGSSSGRRSKVIMTIAQYAPL